MTDNKYTPDSEDAEELIARLEATNHEVGNALFKKIELSQKLHEAQREYDEASQRFDEASQNLNTVKRTIDDVVHSVPLGGTWWLSVDTCFQYYPETDSIKLWHQNEIVLEMPLVDAGQILEAYRHIEGNHE